MNLKKTLKYFSLAVVSVLAIGALVACSSSSEKKTFNEELILMVKNFDKFYKSRSK